MEEVTMENFILSQHLVSVSLLTISILYCIIALYFAFILKNVGKLIIISILYFILAFFLSYILYFQETKEICNSRVIQNKSITKTKDQDNILSLKMYLKTYYKRVPDEIEDIIAKATNDLSHKHHIDFNLVVGIIGVESSFNPYAISKVGARGLMQVRYCVWKNYLKIPNRMELHNIYEGVEYGILAFLQCRKEAKGDLILALQKYNGTKRLDYVNKVNKEKDRFILLKLNKGEPINDSQFNQRLSSKNKGKTE